MSKKMVNKKKVSNKITKFNQMINKNDYSIWRYKNILPHINMENRLTLGEGWTPAITIKKLDKKTGIPNLYLKNEGQNPNGSHKDRGVAFQLSKASDDGQHRMVLCSSGNSAISAAAYSKLNSRIKVKIFISKTANRVKIRRLLKLKANIAFCKNAAAALKKTYEFSSKKHAKNINPSLDIYAAIGYETIAYEIFEQLGKIDAIFIPVSSGATLCGIDDGFKKLKKLRLIKSLPQIHAVQTTAVAPIAEEFTRYNTKYKKEKKSLADGIIAKNTARKHQCIRIIRESNGSGWVVNDKKILDALYILNSAGLNPSYEGAAALAGIIDAKKKMNAAFRSKKIVCLLTASGYGNK